MQPILGISALLSMLSADPFDAAPWALPRSDMQEIPAPDGHLYRILVSWPEGEPPAQGWPVLWLLGGEDDFAIATMTARRLARSEGIAEGVIVTIESGSLERRIADYTPAVPGYAIPKGFPASGVPTGGAERFLDLIEETFRPLVEGRWHLDPAQQTLAGHNFGGLLALHSLFTRRCYSTIVAVNPSLWFGGGMLEAQERKADPTLKARLLIASGTAERGPDGCSGAAGEALVARWQNRGAQARYLALRGRGHGSPMFAAMTATVATAFAG
ncbi:hypothetical protein EDF56_101865 [Novosphingobium sp. PhB165]|uniref:alpha/beta hydrolase n=1 Tax=Novosphingobium sp. PhB165 TaxID=2485105 RepID=UPI0010DACD30|nr:alpha/beta hydrolase-fold protein [Novosphingobium sp. PhB165]TCM22183.1 hypothetical protein EDF56_101865 [Novosphingobium sp. PhB165]